MERGFTLVEIIVAMAIILVITAVIAPWIVTVTDDARKTRMQKDLEGIADSARHFALQSPQKRYPRSMAELFEAGLDAPIGRFSRPVDPWGYPYEYVTISSGGFTVFKVKCSDDSPALEIYSMEDLMRVIGRE